MNMIFSLFLLIKFFFMTSVITAFSSEDYYEGKEAEKLIKLGIIQETIEEGDHKHVVVEFDNDFFWCTIEKNGKKTCVLY